MNKKLITFALCLTVLLVGTFLGFYGTSTFYKGKIADEKFITKKYENIQMEKGEKAAANAVTYKVRVGQAQKGTAQQFRTLIGRLEEIRRSTISAEVSGKIVEIYVEKGSHVKEHVVKYEDSNPSDVSLDSLLEDNERFWPKEPFWPASIRSGWNSRHGRPWSPSRPFRPSTTTRKAS